MTCTLHVFTAIRISYDQRGMTMIADGAQTSGQSLLGCLEYLKE